MADDHEHEHAHEHGALAYEGARVEEDVLQALRESNPDLAESLALSRAWAERTDDEKRKAAEAQRAVEAHEPWTPGYHAAGDRCVVCGEPTQALFEDVFAQGALPYAAFRAGLPVHPREACLSRFMEKVPRIAPQVTDRLRRSHTTDLERPTPRMAMFFRHDVLAHPPFALEDWANSVAEANRGLDRAVARDIERLLHWVHRRLYH